MTSAGSIFSRGGFRGYSGSERLAITVAETEATPGYLAGPLNPGRWHLMLGLYKVAAGACCYHVQIDVTLDGAARAPESLAATPRDLPASPPPGRNAPWLCGDLHCHSQNSDGDASPAEIVEMARQRGLDFLAVTDHNTVAASRELALLRDPGLVLVAGVEVTTYLGHMHVLGTTEWIDFRALTDGEMAEAAAYARARGAVLSCNHPKPLGPDWRFSDAVTFRRRRGVERTMGGW